MEYRLLKELPFAKVGAKVRFHDYQFEAMSDCWSKSNNQFYPFAPAMESSLITTGWIEKVNEVKSKTLYVITHKNGESTLEETIPETCIRHECKVQKVQVIE